MIVDVPRMLVELGIDADRRGHDFWASCPIPGHVDGAPSWHITDRQGANDHGSWHCFGCGSGGGPVALVMERIGISFGSARDWLRDHACLVDEMASGDVELVLVDRRPKPPFVMPSTVRQAPLIEWPDPARRYASRRGITATMVRRCALGYAVEGRLAGRIVFPFLGEDGRPESYSGRTYTGHELRYLTPHRNEGASPDAVFGAHLWPAKEEREVVVVGEGAINALACWRAVEFKMSFGALSGSQPSPGQIGRLASFPRVLIATDPDGAGEHAAETIDVLRRWTRVERVEIDRGQDAQSMPLALLGSRILEALEATW